LYHLEILSFYYTYLTPTFILPPQGVGDEKRVNSHFKGEETRKELIFGSGGEG
jgi:hypothetical protein